MSNTVQNMRHFIRTAYDDSDCHYDGDPLSPLQGGDQGSPAAPPMWVAMTVLLVKIACEYEPGFALMSAISHMLVAFSAIMYVDDTDLFNYAPAYSFLLIGGLMDYMLLVQYYVLKNAGGVSLPLCRKVVNGDTGNLMKLILS